jgi:hypothetical protein
LACGTRLDVRQIHPGREAGGHPGAVHNGLDRPVDLVTDVRLAGILAVI